MLVATKVVIEIESGKVLHWEGYEYFGPVALCDRGQSTQAFNTASQNSAQNQQNAQGALTGANTGLTSYLSNLQNFQSTNPYSQGGQFAQDTKAMAQQTSQANQNSLANAMKMNAARTGENTAGNATALATAKQGGLQNLQNFLAQQDQQRLAGDTNYKTTALQAGTFPVTAQNQQYATALGGANSAEGTAAQAAGVPSGWQVFGQDVAQGAGSTIGAVGGLPAFGGAGGAGRCWVAMELYGPGEKYILLRHWIFNVWNRRPIGSVFASLYERFGERAALIIQKNRAARSLTKLLFDRLVVKASKELE